MNMIKINRMKKSFYGFLLFFILISLFSCSQPTENNTITQKDERTTRLTLKNESSFAINNVKWGDTIFGNISPGMTVSRDVESGISYIYFGKTVGNVPCRTNATLAVSDDEKKEFVFLDSTIVVDTSNVNNIDILSRIATIKTILRIRNQSSVRLYNVRWGNTTFGSFDGGADISKEVDTGAGHLFFTKIQGDISCRTNEIVTVNNALINEFTFFDETMVTDTTVTDNVNTLYSIGQPRTTLVINNQSFSDLIMVTWQGIEFTDGNSENIIKRSFSVTRDVTHGSGYIYLRLKSKPIPVRTKDLISIEKYEQKAVILSENTVVVDVSNTSMNYTLSELVNINWTPAWIPPLGANLFNGPGIDNAMIGMDTRAGDVFWFRIYALSGTSYYFRVFDCDGGGTVASWADVVSDFYFQDGTVIMENVDYTGHGINCVPTISQFVYVRVRVVAANNGTFAVYYNLE